MSIFDGFDWTSFGYGALATTMIVALAMMIFGGSEDEPKFANTNAVATKKDVVFLKDCIDRVEQQIDNHRNSINPHGDLLINPSYPYPQLARRVDYGRTKYGGDDVEIIRKIVRDELDKRQPKEPERPDQV